MQNNAEAKTLKEITTEGALTLSVSMEELTAMLASVNRLLYGVSTCFERTLNTFNEPTKARNWMADNYEIVGGAVQTAAAATNIIFTALDENIVNVI